MLKKKISLIMAVVLSLALVTAGCGKTNTSTSSTSSTATKEKVNLKFYGKIIEYTSGEKMVTEMQSQLKNQYNIESIQVDWGNLDKAIRTGIASGEPCDVYCYPSGQMTNFKDMAADLTPYLTANNGAWKNTFPEAALSSGVVDGKNLSIPFETNFPTILANKDILDKAGVTVPETWTFEQFNEACKKIKAIGVFPFANATDLGRSSWTYRNAILSVTKRNGKYEDMINHKLPGTDDSWKTALTGIKGLYDSKYMYPGDGAVTVKNDEIKAAFSQGKVAMMGEIAAGAKQTSKGFTSKTVILPWPSVGSKGAINGSINGFFIPKNSKHIADAVKALQTFTNEKVQAIHATDGYIPVNVNVKVTDPFVQTLVKNSSQMVGQEENYTTLADYGANKLMAELILGGGVNKVQTDLEKMRQEYLKTVK